MNCCRFRIKTADVFSASCLGIIGLIVLGLCFSSGSLTAADPVPANATAAGEEFFEKQVRPLLLEQCGKCHGPDKQFAGLRLDSREAMLKGGDTGAALIPGQPDASRMIEAVRYKNEELQMPPDGKRLSAAQVAVLEKWVQLGAPWPAKSTLPDEEKLRKQKSHWAFQPVRQVTPPELPGQALVKTPVDQFLLQRLNSEGLVPSPVADRRTLIRRVTYDLTGLPPTLKEVHDFVNDPRPQQVAYEALVERLLASPHYGEQWARHWLDVARYSDSKGYVYAREERFWVHAASYRDWVVQAFNRDLPYDQFLLLQMAADQIAPDDKPSLAAMGFLTLGRRFLGVTHDIIDDRIDVVTRGTMGLTVACARCHEHKFDPIPTADYYSLYGIFQNCTERVQPIAEPAERNDAYAAYEKELQVRTQKLRDTTALKHKEAAERVRSKITEYLVSQTELSKYPEEGFDVVLQTSDLIPTFIRRWEGYLAALPQTDPVFGPWKQLAALPADRFESESPAVLARFTQANAQAAAAAGGTDGNPTATPANALPFNPRVLSALTPPPKTMREVAERYGKLFLAVDAEWKALVEAASKTPSEAAPVALPAPEAEQLRQVMYASRSPCRVPNEEVVSTEFFFDSATCNELWKLQGEVDRWLIQSPLSVPQATYLVDREEIRPARVFRRGNPANKGEAVERHFLTLLSGPQSKPFAIGSGRLELARAIVDPANPLTARVWVNRVWQHHFGTGLVRTPSDFGVRAEPPTHPELLDWLATQLISHGWSTKHLHRLILLSNAYQQRSDGPVDLAVRTQQLQRDPDNRLLWRMNDRRLSFEEFRDTLLAVTGRLDERLGGRATDLFAGGGLSHRRRTLYGTVDRQFLPATMRVFDFANPDLHIPQRSDTIVPQQALFGLNHPLMAEQARALLQVATPTPNPESAERIRNLYRAAFQREPSEAQLAAALEFIAAPDEIAVDKPRVESQAWQYGFGEYDETMKQVKSFTKLPFFTGSAWQGGPQWPDAKLGWVQLTAQGGHTGNDLAHSAIRRWTAPQAGKYRLTSLVTHEVAAGDGIRCWIVSNKGGLLASAAVHNRKQELNVGELDLQAGDTVDFIADLHANLNSEQHLWGQTIERIDAPAAGSESAPNKNGPESNTSGTVLPRLWNSEKDFTGPPVTLLSRWEQLAQVLLLSNELMFVD